MRLDRRKALGLLGAGALPAGALAAPTASGPVFRWGVASGDPLAHAVLLWTACATPGLLRWELAADRDFAHVVRRGTAAAEDARDRTVKVDVHGLQPGTDYFYRFSKDGEVSPVGRTRTLPVGALRELVLAVVTCSLYPNGYFNAYAAIAREPRLDAVIHLGDYIYEYGGPGTYGMNSPVAHERPHDPPHDCVSLADYRRRHAQYKTDPDLQAAHAAAPWIVVWDDHESANDCWVGGAENHRPATEGDWTARKAAAIKAYYEWMPIREPADGGFAIWRSFDFGDLASLFMFETRLTARDQQVTLEALPRPPSAADLATFRARIDDPARKMMSRGQEAWLAAGLKASVASGRPWQVLGNQVVMARIAEPSIRAAMGEALYGRIVAHAPPRLQAALADHELTATTGLPYLLDSWGGYAADRQRLYRIFEESRANAIVVSGDSHAFWANELYDAPEGGRLAAVEFGTTAITSPGDGDYLPGLPFGELFVQRNREVRYCHQSAKGYVRLTLTHAAALGELVAVSTIDARQFDTRVLKRYRATPGADGISPLSEV